jgi:hypothetical protein
MDPDCRLEGEEARVDAAPLFSKCSGWCESAELREELDQQPSQCPTASLRHCGRYVTPLVSSRCSLTDPAVPRFIVKEAPAPLALGSRLRRAGTVNRHGSIYVVPVSEDLRTRQWKKLATDDFHEYRMICFVDRVGAKGCDRPLHDCLAFHGRWIVTVGELGTVGKYNMGREMTA